MVNVLDDKFKEACISEMESIFDESCQDKLEMFFNSNNDQFNKLYDDWSNFCDTQNTSWGITGDTLCSDNFYDILAYVISNGVCINGWPRFYWHSSEKKSFKIAMKQGAEKHGMKLKPTFELAFE